MHSFTEVKVNRALQDCNWQGLLHTSTSGGLPWKQYQKSPEKAMMRSDRKASFTPKRNLDNS